MIARLFATRVLLACVVASFAAGAHGATVTIEPDSYPSGMDISHVGPGLRMFTYRRNPAAPAALIGPVLAVEFPWSPPTGSAPTGIKVFGHPESPVVHWGGLRDAYSCLHGAGCGGNFYVFVAAFAHKTSFVEIRTPMMDWSIDGAELWALNSRGERIAECYISGVTDSVRRTGVMENPTYGTRMFGPPPGPPIECGKVLERIHCVAGGAPGECQFNARMSIKRPNRDIAYIMWGALRSDWSTAPVDVLRYDF